MVKGHYSIRYNPDKLREMINEGKRAREIMKEFKISPYTLWEHLHMLQELDRKVYYVNGIFDDSEAEKPKNRQVGIVLSEEMLGKSGFKPGDAFELIAEEGQIILRKFRDQ